MIFNDVERRSKTDMKDDVMCNRFATGLANVIVMTQAMSHRAKLVTPLTIIESQNFLSRLVVDSLHLLDALILLKTTLPAMVLVAVTANALGTMVEPVTGMEALNFRTIMRTAPRTRVEARARVRCVTRGGLTSTPP
jgi:hypothetical protein